MTHNNDSVHVVADDDCQNYATNSKDNKFVGGNLRSLYSQQTTIFYLIQKWALKIK